MLLPEHKFIVEKVLPTQKSRNGKHEFKKIILKKPGWKDEFGEKKGQDDLLECSVWNKGIEELPALKAGDKVKALLILNGREHIDAQKSEVYYSLQLNIRKIELL